MKFLFSILTLVLVLHPAFSQQKSYKIGDNVEDFSLVNATDQKMVSLASFSQKKALVIVFNSHNCPYSKLYDARLKALTASYESKGVAILLINPNNPELNSEDALSEMAKASEELNYPYVYLADPLQTISNRFDASKTPEVFVLKSHNGRFILKYSGAIDDNPKGADTPTNHYLIEALEAVLCNKVVKISEKKATGCLIHKLD